MRKLALISLALLALFMGCPKSNEIATIVVTPAADTVGVDSTVQFTAVAYDSSNTVIDNVDFTWASTNTAVATVSTAGLATAVATGSCNITATSGTIVGTAILAVTTGPTYHHGDITADETWYPVGNPHIIDGDVNVWGNATLTIKPWLYCEI